MVSIHPLPQPLSPRERVGMLKACDRGGDVSGFYLNSVFGGQLQSGLGYSAIYSGSPVSGLQPDDYAIVLSTQSAALG